MELVNLKGMSLLPRPYLLAPSSKRYRKYSYIRSEEVNKTRTCFFEINNFVFELQNHNDKSSSLNIVLHLATLNSDTFESI